jgi:DNA-binding PadR family transcriptional regulator
VRVPRGRFSVFSAPLRCSPLAPREPIPHAVPSMNCRFSICQPACVRSAAPFSAAVSESIKFVDIVLCDTIYSMSLMKRDPLELLPLTPTMFEVLIALADGEKHGYAIIKEISRRTGGQAVLGAGTLYAIIRRFVDEEIIEETVERPDPALDDERRRYYRLTDFGRAVARAEAARMEKALRMARSKQLLPRPRQA